MSLLDRFRNRDNVAMVLTFQYPKEKPVIELTARRLSQSQINVANIAAMKHPTEVVPFQGWVGYEITGQLVGHITGWRALDGSEMPPFNRSTVQELVDSLTIEERIFIGLAYSEAAGESEKKSEPATSSEPVS